MFGYGTFAQVTFAQGPFVQEEVIVVSRPDTSDGKPRRRKDRELTDEEVEVFLRSRRAKKQADIEPALIVEPEPETVPAKELTKTPQRINPVATAKDAAALLDINAELGRIAKEAAREQRRMREEDDAESLLLLS